MMCNGHTDASMQGQTDLKIEMVMSKINFCHCINGGGGSCSRLGAQFIIEARILGAQSHHFIYQCPNAHPCALGSAAPDLLSRIWWFIAAISMLPHLASSLTFTGWQLRGAWGAIAPLDFSLKLKLHKSIQRTSLQLWTDLKICTPRFESIAAHPEFHP